VTASARWVDTFGHGVSGLQRRRAALKSPSSLSFVGLRKHGVSQAHVDYLRVRTWVRHGIWNSLGG
jgi:hypothetical protein